MPRFYHGLVVSVVCALFCPPSFGINRRMFLWGAGALGLTPPPTLAPATTPSVPVVDPLVRQMQVDNILMVWRDLFAETPLNVAYRRLDALRLLARRDPNRVSAISKGIERVYSEGMENGLQEGRRSSPRQSLVIERVDGLLHQVPHLNTIQLSHLSEKVFEEVKAQLPTIYEDLAQEFGVSVDQIYRSALFMTHKESLIQAAAKSEFVDQKCVFSERFISSFVNKIAPLSIEIAFHLREQNRGYNGGVENYLDPWEISSAFDDYQLQVDRIPTLGAEVKFDFEGQAQSLIEALHRAETIIANLKMLEASHWTHGAIQAATEYRDRVQEELMTLPNRVRKTRWMALKHATKDRDLPTLQLIPTQIEWKHFLFGLISNASIAKPWVERLLTQLELVGTEIIGQSCSALLETPTESPVPSLSSPDGMATPVENKSGEK